MFPWFALQVRGRFEDRVASHLQGQGYEHFLPKYSVRRKWSDRMQTLHVPLFAGYIFCRFNPQERRPILLTPGVLAVVGISKTPIPILDEEISALQRAVNSGLTTTPSPFLKQGDKVRVECGPLRGLEGILVGFRGQSRVIVSVTLLQRSIAVDVQAEWLNPVGKPSPPHWMQAVDSNEELLGSPVA